MRLLLLTTEFPPGPGGIGTHAYQLAQHLTQLGWYVTVISPQDYISEADIQEFNRKQSYSIVHLNHSTSFVTKGLSRLKVVHAWMHHHKPHVMLASGSRAVWLAALLADWHNTSWGAIGHGSEFAMPTYWENMLTKWAYERADSVVCVSEYTRSRMLEAGITPKKETVITNGADADQFYPLELKLTAAFRQQFGLTNAFILLTVGNVTERKGQDIVIQALPYVLEKIPDVHYLIVGLPTQRENFTKLAKQLGVAARVHFLGHIDARTLLQAYNACDIFVMTSRHAQNGDFEGYGIAVVEAALCGKPAVVSHGAGLEEAICANKTGLLVKEADSQDTARAILHLLQNKITRDQMGKQARKRALHEQTWEQKCITYDVLLRQMITTIPPNRDLQL